MIVRRFLKWIETAPPSERADATSALARAYLWSDLAPEDRAAAEAAMVMLLDDPSPLVRLALAHVLASHPEAPRSIVLSLAADQDEIAAVVLAASPLFLDAELVDAVAIGGAAAQAAIAGRPRVSPAVAAALGEVGSAEACLILLENPDADVAVGSLERIIARHGHLAAVREALLAREDLPSAIRDAVIGRLSETLAAFVSARAWLPAERAERVAREAHEQASIRVASAAETTDLRQFVRRLSAEGRLSGILLLRAVLSGQMRFVEEALAELAALPAARVSAVLHDRRGTGLVALFERASIPPTVVPGLKAAVAALHEVGFAGDALGEAVLRRRMIERAIIALEATETGADQTLLALLRRFSQEAARAEAHLHCADLIAA